mgnify:CR=1 FL=1
MEDFKDLLKLSPEQEEKMRTRTFTKLKATDLNYELGYLLGRNLTDSLPGLSIDMIQKGQLIKVSAEEEKVYNTLSDSCFYHIGHWDKLKKYYNTLKCKYLPKTHKITLSAVNITDMEEFKKGLSSAIWMCDHSHYSTELEDITVEYSKDHYSLNIILKLVT